MTAPIDARVLDVLNELIGSPAVRADPNLRLFELGLLDSLKVVELVIMLSTAFDTQIGSAELDREECETAAGIAAFVGRKTGES